MSEEEKTPVQTPYGKQLEQEKFDLERSVVRIEGLCERTNKLSKDTYEGLQKLQADMIALTARVESHGSRLSNLELQRIWFPMLIPTALALIAIAASMWAIVHADGAAERHDAPAQAAPARG